MKKAAQKESMNGWKWWQEAWYDTEGARLEFFVVGLLFTVVSLSISRIPLLSELTPHIFFPHVLLAMLEFSKHWREKRKKDFGVLIIPFKDPVLFKKLLPLSAVGLSFGLAYWSCNWAANILLGLGFFRFLLNALEIGVFSLAVPLVIYKKEEPFIALRNSLRIFFENLPTFAVFYGVMILSILLGVATVGIGFFFLVPLYVYLPYLIYQQVLGR